MELDEDRMKQDNLKNKVSLRPPQVVGQFLLPGYHVMMSSGVPLSARVNHIARSDQTSLIGVAMFTLRIWMQVLEY